MPTVEKELVIYDLKQQTPGMFPDKSRPPFTVDEMRNAVEQFNPGYFKPPCHHGHPRSDATDLALGTVKALRFDGQKLRGKVRVDQTVADDFDEDRLLGLSPEFYRNFEGDKGVVLRGIGFLGATPPRQKGLSMSIFSEDEKGDYDIIVFSDNQEPGETLMPEQTALPNVTPAVPAGILYTEDQINAREDAAVKAALEAASKSEEFAEAEKAHAKLLKDNEQLKKDLEAQKAKDAQADIERFADSLDYLTAGQRPDVIALVTQLESAEDVDIEVFAEDGKSVQVSPRDLVARITKPVGESIKQTLGKVKAGAEKPSGTGAGEITLENFAEHEETEKNVEAVMALWLEKNEGKSKSEAVVYFSEHEEHSDWFHRAGNPAN